MTVQHPEVHQRTQRARSSATTAIANSSPAALLSIVDIRIKHGLHIRDPGGSGEQSRRRPTVLE